jgi:hypothetical protein
VREGGRVPGACPTLKAPPARRELARPPRLLSQGCLRGARGSLKKAQVQVLARAVQRAGHSSSAITAAANDLSAAKTASVGN